MDSMLTTKAVSMPTPSTASSAAENEKPKDVYKRQVLGQAFLPQRACNALAHVGKVAARTFAKFLSLIHI